MTYHECKQVLDAGVKRDDLVVVDFNNEGTAMLEDGIFVRPTGPTRLPQGPRRRAF